MSKNKINCLLSCSKGYTEIAEYTQKCTVIHIVPIRADIDTHGAKRLRSGDEILLKTMDNQLTGSTIQPGHGLENGL